MARNRRGNGQRIETSVELVKIVAHTKGNKTVYRGIIKHEGKEYSFTANTKCIPVVLGAPSIEIMKDTAKAINNWHKENKRGGQFYKDIENLFNCAEIKLYTKEMDKGIFMLKNSAGYMGYLPGAAGLRAVYMNHKDKKPYSCALKSWSKLIDNNDAKPFRTMESQGQKIREEMIPELMRIVAILNKQTNKPDPDGPGPNKTKDKVKEETKPEPQTNTQQEQQQTNEEPPQRTTRRRTRRTVGENIDTNPKHETKESYCGCCNKDTEQEIISDSELRCKECGSTWERFDEKEPQQETEEEIIQETVEEEMEQAMNEEMKKVEEQMKKELEQTKEEVRQETEEEEIIITEEEIPQVTNEDMHNKDTEDKTVRRTRNRRKSNTNDEHEQQHEDNGPSNTGNTNDIGDTQTNDESTDSEYDDGYDDVFGFDTDADEAGDSFEVEGGVLW